MIGLHHYLALGTLLFVLGIIGVAARKNAVGILISIELMLNGAAVNFAAFSKFTDSASRPAAFAGAAGLDGQVFVIFIVLLAACEAAVALAIILNLFNMFGSIEVDDADTMSG